MDTIHNYATIADLGARAKKRLPSFVWRYLYAGAGDDGGVTRNQAAFEQILFRARRFAGSLKSTEVELFGKTYSQPFGVSPVGLCDLFWPGSDRALSKLAVRKNIPLVLSTGSSTSVEEMAKRTEGNLWFQCYLMPDRKVMADLLRRAWESGVRTLVFTSDTIGPRLHHAIIRADHPSDLIRRSRIFFDCMFHPTWALTTLFTGKPKFGNLENYETSARQLFAEDENAGLTWDDFKRTREMWKGKLVVKGILEAEDAVRAVREGADGIWVSNHGGRRLETLPASITALPAIRKALGPSVPVVIDSGVRSGDDVVKALALGANFVFSGRCFVFGAAAFGPSGVERAYDILAYQLKTALMQIGCNAAKDLNPGFIL